MATIEPRLAEKSPTPARVFVGVKIAPIDVAAISKGEGFAWAKNKNSLKREDASAFLTP